MTRWIRPGTGCCVLSALFAIALAGCGSSSTGPAPTTPDASALPDAIGVADTTPGPVAIADAGSAPDIVTAMSVVQRIANPQVRGRHAEAMTTADKGPV